MPNKEIFLKDVFTRLIHDLKTKKTFCYVKDYPGIQLKQLNSYAKKHGPLANPVFGEQPAFFIDESRYIPFRMVNYGNAKVACKIAACLLNWSECSGDGGMAITSQEAFIFDTTIRMPDVAYTSRNKDQQQLTAKSCWTYAGEPFVPTFVVEIDKLSGQGSQRRALDQKMRMDYFRNGVQLGWLIDPRPECQLMYEYFIDDDGDVKCSDSNAWRDLNGGNVLSGFEIRARDLELVLNQDSGSSSEEEVDLVCPIPTCKKRFRSLGSCRAHVEWHHRERAILKYKAKRGIS